MKYYMYFFILYIIFLLIILFLKKFFSLKNQIKKIILIQIKKLKLDITDLRQNISSDISIEIKQKDYKCSRNSSINNEKNELISKKEKINKINNLEDKSKDIIINNINIYNNQKQKKQLNNKNYNKYQSNIKNNKEFNEQKNFSKDSTSQKKYGEYSNNKNNFNKYNTNLILRNKNYKYIRNYRGSDRNDIYSEYSVGTNMENSSYSEYEKPKITKRVVYSFNLFEIIIVLICKCCLCKKISLKNNVNEKANDILFKKIYIITYIRNMILFDLINNIIIEDDKIPIINFFCRPLISLNKSEKNKYDIFYRNFKEKDFN